MPNTTQYGYRRNSGTEVYSAMSGAPLTRDEAETVVKMNPGYALVAREVSASRVVSIR